MTRLALRIALLVCWLAPALSALAQEAHPQGGQSKAAAEALFREGRALLERGELDEACAKLDQSLRLDRSPGTLLNLADCHERRGQSASAWAEFLEAARLADDTGWHAGAREAERRAAALEPRLSRLIVHVSEPLPGLTVTLDGTPLQQAALGTALPIDPGERTLAAEAPGRQPWSTRVRVEAQAARAEVVVPALAPGDDAATAPGEGAAPHDDTLSAAETDMQLAQPSAGGSVLPWVIGGVGVAALATGVVLGVLAKGSYGDAEQLCPERVGCEQPAIDERDEAELQANLSNVGFGVGIVALGVATILLLTADAPEEHATAGSPTAIDVAFSPAGPRASLRARF